MSTQGVINIFVTWFRRLPNEQQHALITYLLSDQSVFRDVIGTGAFMAGANVCPTCGKRR